MNETIKKRGYYIILGIIFIFGFFLRLKWLIVNPSFWNDECSLGWNVINKSFIGFSSILENTQVAPPFFMMAAKLFTKFFGISDFVLRLTPFLFGILSMIMFFIISDKLFCKKITTIISTLIFSINANMINYASEFKQYSCDVFFTLLCFYLFLDLILNKSSVKKIVVYSFVFSITVWFSFVSIFVITAGFITLFIKLIKEKYFDIKKMVILTLPFFISCLLCLKFYIIKTYASNFLLLNDYWQNSYIAKDFSNFFALLMNDIGYFIFPSNFTAVALLILLVGIFVLFKKNFYPALVLLLTIFLECVASWLGFYPFEKRVILFLLPIVLIFITAIFETVSYKKKFKSAFIILLFILIFIQPFSYCYSYMKTPKPNRGYYSREMMEAMAKKIKPDEIVLVNKYSRMDFAYYSMFYKMKNKVVQEGQDGDGRKFLDSLETGKHYWLYMPFGPPATFNKWFPNKQRQVLLEINGNAYPSKTVYFYVN